MGNDDKLIASLEAFLNSDVETIKDDVEKLLKDYSRKSKRLDKIIHQSDKQQRELLELNEELERTYAELNEYKKHLEDKIKEGISEIKGLNVEIEETQKEVVFTMGAIGESRSRETGNHVKRVAEYSKILALAYGMDENEAEMLKQASPMHDIGKVAIPDVILNKPERFNEEEFQYMQRHAELGYEMLQHSSRALLQAAATVAYEHHEKWAGGGYPRNIQGEEIHIYGRITAVADVFDALSSNRCYKTAWDDKKIFELFKEERGRQFDPKLIDLFFENLDAILDIRDKYRDEFTNSKTQ
ncbi:MAG: HD domain-containing phosphohydrolase [Sulfurimonadaceae bacterium]